MKIILHAFDVMESVNTFPITFIVDASQKAAWVWRVYIYLYFLYIWNCIHNCILAKLETDADFSIHKQNPNMVGKYDIQSLPQWHGIGLDWPTLL